MITVKQLKDAADKVLERAPDAKLMKNQVGNLSILDNDQYAGFIDLNTGEVDFFEDPTDPFRVDTAGEPGNSSMFGKRVEYQDFPEAKGDWYLTELRHESPETETDTEHDWEDNFGDHAQGAN